jgi:hypothetical protein
MACGGSVTLSAEGARRVRRALALADAELRQIEYARAHPRAPQARAARIEIGAALAHVPAPVLQEPTQRDEAAP